MLHKVRLEPLERQEGTAAMGGEETVAVLGVRMKAMEDRITGDVQRVFGLIDNIRALFVEHTKEIQELKVAVTEFVRFNSRITALETLVNTLPARVAELELHGSKAVQDLPVKFERIDNRLDDLEKKPKEQEEATKRRQNRVLTWATIGGCAFMLASCVLTAAGIGLSFYLAHH